CAAWLSPDAKREYPAQACTRAGRRPDPGGRARRLRTRLGSLVGRGTQILGGELGLAALGLGVGEVQLDLDAVRIEQEQLVETLVVDLALGELDLVLLEMLDHLQE